VTPGRRSGRTDRYGTWWALTGFGAALVLTAAIGGPGVRGAAIGGLRVRGAAAEYANLRQPSWAPPAWVTFAAALNRSIRRMN
jgi:tryptophan-rich sensory protein